jgi:glyceraldehyde 3-phosphate dehydrogenase
MTRVAINGFGRIGRQVLRLLLEEKDVQLVALNDLVGPEMLAQLFEFDSLYGRVKTDVKLEDGHLICGDQRIAMFAEADPSKLPWKDLNVDVVLECTGRFKDEESAKVHIEAGARKVLISAPAKDPIKNVVFGVNDDVVQEDDVVLSAASCTTNCLAPMVKVLHKQFGIEKGFIATTHAYTGDQRLMDAPHADMRRARAAALNVIPTSTGAAKAIGKVFPDLKGKLDGNALRVPVASGSMTEATFVLNKETNLDEVLAAFRSAANGELKGIMAYSEKPLVSSDILGDTHSCTFDAPLTQVSGSLVRVFGWYDNEVGYSARMIDLMKKM